MLIGHQKQWEFLKKSAWSGRLAHALLFSGQEQLGKKKTAIELAKFLFCQNKNYSERPCQNCRSCRDIERNINPDFILLADPSESEIPVSKIRELVWKLSLKPYSAPLKIALIDRAHLMNQESQNCLLKTLEEPKDRSLLILVTEYPNMLFPTVLSRLEQIKFFPVEKEKIKNYFIKKAIKGKKLESIVDFSRGRPGKAITFYLNNDKIKEEEKLISDLDKIRKSEMSRRFFYIKDLKDLNNKKNDKDLEKERTKEILDIWLNYFRNLLFLKLNGKVNQDYSLLKIKKIISLIQHIHYLISTTNINRRLAMEMLLLEI